MVGVFGRTAGTAGTISVVTGSAGTMIAAGITEATAPGFTSGVIGADPGGRDTPLVVWWSR